MLMPQQSLLYTKLVRYPASYFPPKQNCPEKPFMVTDMIAVVCTIVCKPHTIFSYIMTTSSSRDVNGMLSRDLLRNWPHSGIELN